MKVKWGETVEGNRLGPGSVLRFEDEKKNMGGGCKREGRRESHRGRAKRYGDPNKEQRERWRGGRGLPAAG